MGSGTSLSKRMADLESALNFVLEKCHENISRGDEKSKLSSYKQTPRISVINNFLFNRNSHADNDGYIIHLEEIYLLKSN